MQRPVAETEEQICSGQRQCKICRTWRESSILGLSAEIVDNSATCDGGFVT